MNIKVLILGFRNDIHINKLINKLSCYPQVNFKFIDISHDFSEIKYIFSNSQNIMIGDTAISTYHSIYWRYSIGNITHDQSFSIQQLCEEQDLWNFFFPLDAISRIKCVNPMMTNFTLGSKIFQLNLANQIGLKYPSTLISCDYNAVIEFKNKENQCIKKSLGLSWNQDNCQSVTKILDLNNFPIKKNVPHIFQSFIKRKSEIRIYVIGRKIISIKIEIDSSIHTIPDWRFIAKKHQKLIKYSYYDISQNFAKLLFKYNDAANLFYAAYDFIIDQEDEIFFLECNPNGNWDFLPEEISDTITTALIEVLIC